MCENHVSHHRYRQIASHGIAPAKLRKVCDFVRTHLADDIDLATLAGIAGLSRYHFSRVFTRAVGLSPYAYVIVCRIELAKALLGDPGLSFAEIAHQTGFNSAAQLSAMFRRRTGIALHKHRSVLFGEVASGATDDAFGHRAEPRDLRDYSGFDAEAPTSASFGGDTVPVDRRCL